MSGDLEYTWPTEEIPAIWTLTGGDAAPGYTPDALTNDNPAAPYKVASNYLRVVTDLGTATPVALATIIHPNFDAGLGNILLQGGHSPSPGAFVADFTVPFPAPGYFADQFPVNLAVDLRPFGSPSYRWWSLVTGNGTGLVDPNSVAISIGELKLYTAVHAIDGSLTVDLSPTEEERYPVIDHATDGDVTLLHPIGTKRRFLRGGILQESGAADAVQTWHRQARGRSLPFVVLVTSAEGLGLTIEPWFVRFEQSTLVRKFTYGPVASTFDLALEEISRGLRPTPESLVLGPPLMV
jgi:hypothetical protein